MNEPNRASLDDTFAVLGWSSLVSSDELDERSAWPTLLGVPSSTASITDEESWLTSHLAWVTLRALVQSTFSAIESNLSLKLCVPVLMVMVSLRFGLMLAHFK